MKLRILPTLVFIIGALNVFVAMPAFAAATLSISPAGADAFSLGGAGFAGVVGVDITITYDAGALANPQVTKGSLLGNAVMVVNSQSPGFIRIAGVTTSPLSGAGSLATITFTRSGTAQGTITALSAKLVNISGSDIPVKTYVSNPVSIATGASGATAGQDTAAVAPGTSASVPAGSPSGSGAVDQAGTGTAGAPVYLGTVTMPADAAIAPERKKPEAVPVPNDKPVAAPVAVVPEQLDSLKESVKAAPRAVRESELAGQKGVLERFREFKGERKAAAFLAIFEQKNRGPFRQEPTIAVSDGKSEVRVFLDLGAPGETAPNYALQGAKLVSLARGEKNALIITLRPEKGVYQASITVLTGGAMIEYPLTIVPLLDMDLNKSGKVTEEDFNMYLKETGTTSLAKRPYRFDLNGDGKQDYVDDYIFTANYILRVQRSVPK